MSTTGQATVYYRVDLEDGAADTTEVTDLRLIEQLAAQTREDATLPPALAEFLPRVPLGAEASAFADRVRYALMFRLGFGPNQVEDMLDYAISLMPRGGVRR